MLIDRFLFVDLLLRSSGSIYSVLGLDIQYLNRAGRVALLPEPAPTRGVTVSLWRATEGEDGETPAHQVIHEEITDDKRQGFIEILLSDLYRRPDLHPQLQNLRIRIPMSNIFDAVRDGAVEQADEDLEREKQAKDADEQVKKKLSQVKEEKKKKKKRQEKENEAMRRVQEEQRQDDNKEAMPQRARSCRFDGSYQE